MSEKTKNTYKLGWLYPDTLYLHGDRGNILALERIAKEMGMELEVEKIALGDEFDPDDYDILYCPPGEITSFKTIIQELEKVKDKLSAFIDSGKVLLVTGTSVALFGNIIHRSDGEIIDGLRLINIISTEKDEVYGDDIIFETNFLNRSLTAFGNQIQMIDIELGLEKPFGTLYYGYGNSGHTVYEGVLKKNSIFTNVLGPLLVLNPWLTKDILNVMRINRGEKPFTQKLDYNLERQSLYSKIKYTNKKKSSLKNV